MLRVFLPGPLRADRADRWIRIGADGRRIDAGTDVPSRWPVDPKTDLVLAADRIRLIALAMPPMPRDRLRSAVRYALEDQLASDADESAIALGEIRDGRCLVAVVEQALLRTIPAMPGRASRVIPESALAPRADGWTWCASAAGGGFVRRTDGSAFGVGAPERSDDALPPELAVALAQAARERAAPGTVHVAFATDPSLLATWSRAAGVTFEAAPEWHWERASASAFASAPDFVRDNGASNTSHRREPIAWRAFRPALLLAGSALVVALAGLAFEWSRLSIENWRLAHALVDEARASALPEATSAPAAFAAIARRNASLRHRATAGRARRCLAAPGSRRAVARQAAGRRCPIGAIQR